MVNSICVAYFSPTGGTERAARLLAQEFGLPVSYLDLTRPENRENYIGLLFFHIKNLDIFKIRLQPVKERQVRIFQATGIINRNRRHGSADLLGVLLGRFGFAHHSDHMALIPVLPLRTGLVGDRLEADLPIRRHRSGNRSRDFRFPRRDGLHLSFPDLDGRLGIGDTNDHS